MGRGVCMDREIPVLFQNKSECCACGACVNICTQNAISMKTDEYGFLYPSIDSSLCVSCGQCKQVCAYQNMNVQHEPLEAYAAVACDKELLMKSASGGIFAVMARKVIDAGGIVFGAELQSDYSVKHVSITKPNEIYKLQGSKYTQSSTERTYSEIKEYLEKGKLVLFSGTPCQVVGLYGFLRKDYENLLTIDIVCHGVPSNKMFKDYIKILESRTGSSVTDFIFRDKSIGWGKNGSAIIGGQKMKIWQSASSYLYYFSQGWIYRESCYKCKYACAYRPADITIGDYWGVEKQHPDYLGNNGWDESKGISAILVNTKKGQNYLKTISGLIQMKPSTFEKVAAGNGQLRKPSKPGKREEILDVYKNGGWDSLEKRFNKSIGWHKYTSQLKAVLPLSIKRYFKSRR